MKKFVCQICGYVYEGEAAPEYCPQCKAPASKFTEMCGDRTWAAEHIVGIAKDVAEDIKMDLRANFTGECTEVGMYLRVEAENGATAGKFDLASRAKAAGLDAIHDTVHEMAKDEARHGKAFEGLLKRYFNK